MKPPIIAFVCAMLAITACDSKKPPAEVVHRENQPDYFRVPEKDTEMEKAIQTARDTVDTFIAALRTRSETRTHFTVKKPFTEGGSVEHIWLSDATFDGAKFSGRVDNEPVDVRNVKVGQVATASKSEISDWFYIEDGKLVGGYTIRVLYTRMSPEERKEFDSNAGFRLE